VVSHLGFQRRNLQNSPFAANEITRKAPSMFPPIPPWEGLHPLIIHFPIALLIVAPIPILLSLVLSKAREGLQIAALTLILLGAGGAWLARETGEAAEGLWEDRVSAETHEMIEEHAELGETTQVVFLILGGVYAVLLFGPRLAKKDLGDKLTVALHGVYVVIFAGCLLLVANTAHSGGVLVHQQGIRAPLDQEQLEKVKALPETRQEDEDEKEEKD
jgi:uncharacterized membrane protein